MTLSDWIPVLSTTSVLGFVLWLLRSLIVNRLAKSVQHEFDNKLEKLRTDHRKSEESFRADLQAKTAQIESLRSAAMAALTTRQAAVDKRRIDAVDQLWSAVIALGPAKAVSAWISVLKFDAVAEESARNPRMREMFSALSGQTDLQKIIPVDAAKARPFVSQMAWALFSAYQAIVSLAVAKLLLLKTGVDSGKYLNIDSVTRLVRAALPHHAEYIQQHGDAAFHYLLDELESALLQELQRQLLGVESDKASIKQAADILKEVAQVQEALKPAATTP